MAVINLPSTKYRMGQELNVKSDGVSNHSTFLYVKKLEDILSDSLFTQLKNMFLGPIIKAALRKDGGAQKRDALGFSGQLVHFLLCRRIMTTRDNELWFHFAGQPMRFSLREFYLVTGLPCEESDVQHEEQFRWPLCEGKTHTFDNLITQISQLPEDAHEGN